jgi:cell volume regulation protein A
MDDGYLLLVTGTLLVCGLAMSLLAGRLRMPGLVLILGVGMALGSDGAGWIEFGREQDDYELARTVGIVALALILFEGGLAAGFHEIRSVLPAAISLAILGTLLTAVIAGLVASWLFDLSTLEGLLVGSIIASTDGAAIFGVLRGSTLRRRLARTLEAEAGLNDPVAVLLVLGFTEWLLHPGFGLADMAVDFVIELGIGLAVGMAVGWAAAWCFSNVKLASAGLYPVASIAVAALAYGLGDVLHGSGFLAVYLAGLWLGTVQSPARRTVATFHDGLAWVAQLVMFLVLGLLVFPSELGEVALEGTVLALVAAAVARPVAAIVTTSFARFGLREQIVLGWAGLRGAVPVVLALFPVIAGVPRSLEFFNIVFFAVVLSTVLQGTTFEWLARKLRVTSDEAAIPAPLMDPAVIRSLGAEIVEFPVRAQDAAAGVRVRELGLPRDALLNMIVRGEQALPPRGSTRIEAGDRLHVLVRQEAAMEFQTVLVTWREGPLAQARRHAVPRGSTIFRTGPWDDADGDPTRPATVAGVEVIERLRTRRDQPGALVALADGRFAYTGSVMAIGSAGQVQEGARRRLRAATGDAEQSWWREVIGALAAP